MIPMWLLFNIGITLYGITDQSNQTSKSKKEGGKVSIRLVLEVLVTWLLPTKPLIGDIMVKQIRLLLIIPLIKIKHRRHHKNS